MGRRRMEASSPPLGYEIREKRGGIKRRKAESRAERKWVKGAAVGVVQEKKRCVLLRFKEKGTGGGGRKTVWFCFMWCVCN